MQLHQSTWAEIDDYLKQSKGIIVPIGSTEQHGPNGLLGTDALCPEIIAKHAGDASGILVGPTFNVGIAQHHMGFSGTITLRPSTMIAAMYDWVASLRKHGFEHIYWFNGHGGNTATINAAFAEIYAEGSLDTQGTNSPPLKLQLRNWWELSGIIKLCEKMYPEGHGSHATPSEVAVTYYGYPDAVKDVEMSPKIAPNGPIHDAADYRRRFPDGRIGSNPAQANGEDGKIIVEACSKGLIEDFGKFVAG